LTLILPPEALILQRRQAGALVQGEQPPSLDKLPVQRVEPRNGDRRVNAKADPATVLHDFVRGIRGA